MGRPNTNKERTSHGGRGARKNSVSVSRDVQVSKKISYLLRHGAAKEGVRMDEGGWVGCAELLQWPQLRSLGLTFPELQTLVAANDKQRFELRALATAPPSSGAASDHTIRASQGHSLPLDSAALLAPIAPDDPACPPEVVHGTSHAAWARILREGRGLSVMGRRHVHFATAVPGLDGGEAGADGDARPGAGTAEDKAEAEEEEEAVVVPVGGKDGAAAAAAAAAAAGQKAGDGAAPVKVVSGMRASANALVWVDVRASMERAGLQWWRSANGVVLTEGDGDGFVPLEFVRRVVGRGGEVRWTPEG